MELLGKKMGISKAGADHMKQAKGKSVKKIDTKDVSKMPKPPKPGKKPMKKGYLG